MCMIHHYWLFNYRFKFKHSTFNFCHDLTRLSVNVIDIPIITDKDVVLFMTIANMKQLIYKKSYLLSDLGYIEIYFKTFCLALQI